MSAFADLAEFEVKIIADNEDVLWSNLVEIGEGADRSADFVIEGLGFDKDSVAVLGPDSVKLFVGFPGEIVDFEIKIKG